MRIVVAALLLTLAACASRGPEQAVRSDRSVLTRAEIEAAAPSNAFDLVRELRPDWLQVRGAKSLDRTAQVSIYLDEMRLGGPDELRGIRTATIAEIRYLSARDAQARYGLDNEGGAIMISTRDGQAAVDGPAAEDVPALCHAVTGQARKPLRRVPEGLLDGDVSRRR